MGKLPPKLGIFFCPAAPLPRCPARALLLLSPPLPLLTSQLSLAFFFRPRSPSAELALRESTEFPSSDRSAYYYYYYYYYTTRKQNSLASVPNEGRSVYMKCVSRREIRVLGPKQRRRIDDRSVGLMRPLCGHRGGKVLRLGRSAEIRDRDAPLLWHLLHKAALIGDTKIPQCPAVSLGFLFAEKQRDAGGEGGGREGEKEAGHNPSKATYARTLVNRDA